jgi:FkbH-like protein
LEDKFGDNGLICVVILQQEDAETLVIESWFMSCRVLKRGMENFVINTISGFAKAKGFQCLKGEYLPTSKNEMVKDHYANLGFLEQNNYWKLNLEDYQERKTFINIK